MARIRTIKPEFFTSEDIVELEPLARLLYISLWCEADKEGRFNWKPRTFKMRYLPADECDIDALCDALVTRGLVVLYGSGLAFIPSFKTHQHINPREKDSDLPNPNDASSRVTNASPPVDSPSVTRREEGKGREGKGTISRLVADATQPCEPDKFDEFWSSYPRRDGPNPRKPAEQKFSALVKTGVDPAVMIAAVKKLAADESARGNIGTRFIPQAMTWLNQQRWADHAALAFAAVGQPQEIDWDVVLTNFKRFGHWSKHAGPGLDSPACRAPPDLLAKHGLAKTCASVEIPTLKSMSSQ